jgi:flagellar protein FlaG
MVNIMSSNLVLRTISVVQPPAQDATAKRSNVENNVSTVVGIASANSNTGQSLPTHGNDTPEIVLPGNANPQTRTTNNSVNQADVLGAVKNLKDFVQNTHRELNFSIDEQTGYTVVKVIDRETKEVIRQIPAEEVLAVARHITDEMDGKGNLFKGQV